MVRAKFKCTQKVENEHGFTIKLEPVTSGSEENEKFFEATPWGQMEIGTINGEAAKHFSAGGEYYLDISPAS